MSHETPERLGPYRIEKRLGAGGMGEVFRAYDERLGRRVAIKHILQEKAAGQPRAQARFRGEARAAASLSHPSIVQIFDILERDDGDWIVMEFADGPTVASLLEGGPLELQRVLALGRDVAEGLAEAHEEGLVHRDLKTENVIVTGKGRAKILDFGLAKKVWTAEGDSSISRDRSLLGTCRSMSPEQAMGRDVGPASDLFSFGTMLYEMATAVSPFAAASEGETILRVISHRPVPLSKARPEVPDDLANLIDRLLKKAPGKRPESAQMVAEELAGLAESAGHAELVAVSAGASPAGARAAGAAARGARISGASGTIELDLPPRRAPRRPQGPAAASATESAAPSAPFQPSASGERRQVTIMSCELGPAAAGETLDPEELLMLMPAFGRLVSRAIEPFEGHIEAEATLSSSLKVLFGYPRAHADDARRAALGALAIVDQFAAQRHGFESTGTPRLAVRVGIHTGTAVVAPVEDDRDHLTMSRRGEAGAGRLALGETLPLALGIRAVAEPDTVVASEDTYRLIQEGFTCRLRGGFPRGGGPPDASRAIALYRVLEYNDTSQLLEMGFGRAVAQVSRTQELEQILERWELACEGSGQVVLVAGEAGIGKTRLIKSLKGRLVADSRNLVECRCTAFHRHKAFFPFLDFLERTVAREDWLRAETESGETRYDDLPLAHFAPRLADLLESPQLPHDLPLGRDLEPQGQKILESMAALLLEMSADRPLLLVVEDLHWVDPSTLELLTLLIDRVATARMLLVLSFRRNFESPWGSPSHLTNITLSRLPDKQVDVLIGLLAEGRAVPPRLRREIIERADGVPLFVEELTKLVLDASPERGRKPPEPDHVPAIPATLQGWLTARLDRLGPAKAVAQTAAALGREFSYELLREISPLTEMSLQRELDRLVEAELLHRRGLPPRVTYTFKHGLIRDAAHESLLKSRRRQQHERIAFVLEASFPEVGAKEPEVLAYHFTEAGKKAEAVGYWRRAAENAVRASIHLEAIDHARRGLRLNEDLPPSPQRSEEEILLQVYLGLALAAKGYDAPEVEEAYTRALELWQEVEKVPRLFPILDSLVLFYLYRGQVRTARGLAEELLHLTVEADDVSFLPAAHWSLGFVLLLAGDFESSKLFVEEGIAFYATKLSLEDDVPPGMGLAVSTSLGDLSWSLWFLGYPNQARECSRNSLDLIRHSPDAFTRAFALFRASYLHVFLRDATTARGLAEELTAFAGERGFLYFVAVGMFLSGQAMATEGEIEKGTTMMSEGLDGMWATGRASGRPRNMAYLAEAFGRAKLTQQGLSMLREALAAVGETGESHFEAELYRLQGEFLRQQEAPADKVEERFREALDLARRQDSKSLELRAAMSLGRLWRSQGREAQAGELVSEVYGWFTEGFDTADLVEAEIFLESLS